METLIRRRAGGGGQQPGDDSVLVRVLVRQEASQLSVIDITIAHIYHGYDVSLAVVLAYKYKDKL